MPHLELGIQAVVLGEGKNFIVLGLYIQYGVSEKHEQIARGLPVSSSTYKEPRSHYVVLKTIAEQSKKPTLLGSMREGRTKGKPLSPRLERVMNTGSHSFLEQRLTSRNCPRNQSQGTKTKNVIDELLKAQCRQVWELETPGGPSHKGKVPTILRLPPGGLADSNSKHQRKICAVERGREEKLMKHSRVLSS